METRTSEHLTGTLTPSESIRALKRNPPKVKISVNHGSKNIRALKRNPKPHQSTQKKP